VYPQGLVQVDHDAILELDAVEELKDPKVGCLPLAFSHDEIPTFSITAIGACQSPAP
jgi:hypothetical protein